MPADPNGRQDALVPALSDRAVSPTEPASGTTSHDRFQGIQILRGVSVLFTMLAHLPTATAPFAAIGRPAPWIIGVSIFYCISGWIIAHVTRGHTSADIAAFLTRRLFRIVPVLLASLTLTMAFAVVLVHSPVADQFYPDTPAALRASVGNLLFLSDLGQMLSLPAPYSLLGLWSISVEVKFYLVYALLLVLAPAARGWALGLLLLLIGVMRWRLVRAGFPAAFSHVFFLELFCLGGISYRYYRQFRHSWLLAILAWSSVIGFPIIDPRGGAFMPAYGLLLVSVVYIVNHAANAVIGPVPGAISRALIWLGERSYVLYVMHFQILAIAGLFAQLLGVNYWAPTAYSWILNISLVLGLPVIELIHQTIEKGGIRMGTRIAGTIRG